MNRRDFLKLSGASAAVSLLNMLPAAGWGEAAQAAGDKPNILLILADDLGYGGVACQGGDLPTPHVDTIAENGVRLTGGYVSCPLCAPTRAGLLSGRYQQRFGFETNPGGNGNGNGKGNYGQIAGQKLMPQYLQELGYATGMFGKWHLGDVPGMRPTERGFDEFFGFLGAAHSYLPSAPSAVDIYRNLAPVAEVEYLTDALAREAATFIDRHKDEPFFAYLAFNAVHTPLQAPQKYLGRFAHIRDETRRTHAAMLAALDDGVGLVLERLAHHGLERRTLVVFLSDNGGPTQTTTSSNAPLNGVKNTLYEGGIRVPFLVQWKGSLPAGQVYDKAASSLDLLPTFLAAAGADKSAAAGLDGVDLAPYLKGKNRGTPHTDLYWRIGSQWAVRNGDWKLVQTGSPARRMLFNLAEDLGEQRDLSAVRPGRVEQLQARYDAWNSQMMPGNSKKKRKKKKD